jgi:outer membrane receptor protein involved in Fe transport
MNKLIITLILFISITANAQTLIKGKIVDTTTLQPMEYVDILVSGESLEYPIGTITDMDGSFELPIKSGLYMLQGFYVGQELVSKEIEVKDEDIDLGTILVENSQQLDQVFITAKKKLIERKIDRLVFNVENSSKASEGDALEVLRVTPGIRVQNDQIRMIGKSNLQVMINDKIVQLSDEDLANFLKSIASEDIKNIEVITTPPAKYEASGNSGLVNITLKEAKKDSWNAQLKSSYRQRTYASGSGGGSFNFNKDKLSVATSLNYREGVYYQEQDDYAYFPDGLWYTLSPNKGESKGLNARIDINYKITSNWEMGAQYLHNNSNFHFTDAPYTPVFDYDTNEIIRYLESEGIADFNPEIHSINYNNEIKLDTLGRNVTLNLDYFAFKNPDARTYNGISVIQNPFSEQFFKGTNANNQDVTNMSAKLDIEYPLDWIKLSFGGKITNSKSINDITFFNSGLVDTPIASMPKSQNDFEYKEDIQAVYISANKKFSEKWTTQLGLRVETTQTNSMSNNLNVSTKNDYTKLFPTFYALYNASDNSNFSFNYSKRIERPSFFELNPNIYFANPFQTIEGNAFLQPSFIDNFELSNTYKNLSSKLYYSYEDNLFSQVPLADATTNIIRFTNENFINTHRIGISENYTYDKVKWWSSNNSLDINYSKSEFNLEEEQEDQKGINTTISTYNDFNLNTDKTWLMGVNYWYSFPGINGIYETKEASSLSLSLQCLLLEKNLNISLRANDIFKTSAERNVSRVNGVLQTARYYYDSRSVQLSISYKFGNNDLKAKKHSTGNRDERSRTGN